MLFGGQKGLILTKPKPSLVAVAILLPSTLPLSSENGGIHGFRIPSSGSILCALIDNMKYSTDTCPERVGVLSGSGWTERCASCEPSVRWPRRPCSTLVSWERSSTRSSGEQTPAPPHQYPAELCPPSLIGPQVSRHEQRHTNTQLSSVLLQW